MRVAYPSVGKAFRSVKLAWCSYLAVYSALFTMISMGVAGNFFIGSDGIHKIN